MPFHGNFQYGLCYANVTSEIWRMHSEDKKVGVGAILLSYRLRCS